MCFLPGAAFAVHPWLARRPPVTPPAAHQLTDVGRWPAEPAVPPNIDPARFAAAIDHLCGHVDIDPPASTKAVSDSKAPVSSDAGPHEITLGELVLAAATEADVDPFLLGGLMYEQSGCHPNLKAPLGRGLLRISPGMYRSPGAPTPPGDREAWSADALLDPAENLRLGAKLLRMWQDTHVDLDRDFRGVPHRGPVAHFVWGDVVRGSGCEDQALTARRRMIRFYEQTPDSIAPNPKLGIDLICPLEGAPRVASSGPGEDRAGGKRQHQGIDLGAAIGEPVRSVADGTVIFAGVNLASAPRRSLTPAAAARYRWKRLGAGGIYVCVEHAPERHVVSCYMHLDSYLVNEGDVLRAGQILGRVGRTGVQVSPPHLHFELRVDDRHVNPVRYLGDLIIPPKATQTYRYAIRAKRTRLARVQSQQVGLETAAVR
jgi:murein DD-endopeptidase MepM/ murein hydrolase activator NlpD